MSLLRQMMLVMVALFAVLFIANFVLTIMASRVNITTQMSAHAQDTATSLGLSMTNSMASANRADMELLISATFDQGYYQEITLYDTDRQLLVTRSNLTAADDVPEWFTALVALPSPTGRADIMSGWNQLGSLYVQSHPGAAYRDLWQMTLSFLTLLSFICVLAYALLGLILRAVLRPLAAMERQALDIAKRNFNVITHPPSTRELARVVNATNHMAQTLSALFEDQVRLTSSLREEARTDPVTGLANRREFDALAESALRSESGPGPCALILVQLRNFADVNSVIGRARADGLLKLVGERIAAAADYRGAVVARRAGADFGIFLPGLPLENARVALQLVFGAAMTPDIANLSDQPIEIHAGMSFADTAPDLDTLLASADMALRQAQSLSPSGTSVYITGGDGDPLNNWIATARRWREQLVQVLESGDIVLYYQPILDLQTNEVVGYEALTRIIVDNKPINAGTFFPIAERFDLAERLDQLIVQRLLGALGDTSGNLIVNLSTRSIASPSFRKWLVETLTGQTAALKRFVVEFPELALHVDREGCSNLIRDIHNLGYQTSIDHLGTANVTLEYLGRLPLDFAKLDRKYVNGLGDSRENQLIVGSLLQIARTRNLTMIAEGIESEAERNALIELGVPAGLGYLLGRPAPVSGKAGN